MPEYTIGTSFTYRYKDLEWTGIIYDIEGLFWILWSDGVLSHVPGAWFDLKSKDGYIYDVKYN
jgi:hypothetical protein